MFLATHQSLEERVIELLRKGPVRITDLILAVKKQRQLTTKQGIYRVLRLLKKEEVVLIYQKQASLNIRWLNKLNEFSDLSTYYYQSSMGVGHFANLKDGEKIKYTFGSLSFTDAFWNHVLYILLKIVPLSENFFAYNPHAWFFLARQEEEKSLMKNITKDRKYLLTVGHKNIMDKVISKGFDGEKSQYCLLDNAPFADYYYCNVLGNFIIEVFFDRNVSKKISDWYQKTEKMTEETLKDLKNIVDCRGKTKLVISHNAKKAELIKNKFKRNFFLGKIKLLKASFY